MKKQTMKNHAKTTLVAASIALSASAHATTGSMSDEIQSLKDDKQHAGLAQAEALAEQFSELGKLRPKKAPVKVAAKRVCTGTKCSGSGTGDPIDDPEKKEPTKENLS